MAGPDHFRRAEHLLEHASGMLSTDVAPEDRAEFVGRQAAIASMATAHALPAVGLSAPGCHRRVGVARSCGDPAGCRHGLRRWRLPPWTRSGARQPADLRQYVAMADRYRAPGGWAVDVIHLSSTPDHRDGEWLRVSFHGVHVADVRTVPELAQWFALGELEPDSPLVLAA